MKLWRLTIVLSIFIPMMVGTAIVLLQDKVYAASTDGTTAPNPNNSTPNGSFVFYMRRNTALGVNPDVNLTAFYATSENWNGKFLELSPSASTNGNDNVCNFATTNGGKGSDDYIRVTLRGSPTNTKEYIIKANQACRSVGENTVGRSSNNGLYGKYALPSNSSKQTNAATGMNQLDIQIEFVDRSIVDGGARILVKAIGTPSARIGNSINEGNSYPIITKWRDPATSQRSSITMPFGVCGGDGSNKKVGIADADNGNPNFGIISYRVRDTDSGQYVNLRVDTNADGSPQGRLSADKKTYTPVNGERQNGFARVDLDPRHHYELIITDIAERNTIDIQTPPSLYGGNDVCGDTICNESDSCPPQNKTVELVANASAQGATETGEPAVFSGDVRIQGFPQPVTGGWSFVERAEQRRPDGRVTATKIGDQDGVEEQNRYDCPARDNNQDLFKETGTRADKVCYYERNSAPRDGTCSPEQSNGKSGTSKRCLRERGPDVRTVYNCIHQPKPSFQDSPPGDCKKQFQCPGGANLQGEGDSTGWRNNYDDAVCNGWTCSYPNASYPQYRSEQINQNAEPDCSYRCGNGKGDKAYLASGWFNKTINDQANKSDQKCFIVPVFTLACTYQFSDGTGEIVREQVNGESMRNDVGNPNRAFCARSYTKTTGTIGTSICVTLTPSTGGWDINPPGRAIKAGDGAAVEQRAIYSFSGSAAGPECASFYGKPYFKVYGGDVSAGTGLSSGACTSNASATIKAWARNTGAGAGTQGAAFAGGNIDGFVSGQYNPLSSFKSLSFANDSSTGAYGGNLGSTQACADLFKATSSAPTTLREDLAGNSRLPANAGTVNRKYVVDGNVYIDRNIAYNTTTWTAVGDIRHVVVIAKGNIYISQNVTRMDGIYAATGSIYTCADASTFLPITRTVSGCNQQLVVNGALVADNIYLGRDCGSLRYSTTNESPIFSGQGNNQDQCSGGANHAAEVINYAPEIWLGSDPADLNTKYDSIINLPPVL